MKKTFALLALTAALCGQAFADEISWKNYNEEHTEASNELRLNESDLLVVDTSVSGTSISSEAVAHIQFAMDANDPTKASVLNTHNLGAFYGSDFTYSDEVGKAWKTELSTSGSVTLVMSESALWRMVSEYTLNGLTTGKITLGGITYNFMGTVATEPTDIAVGDLYLVAPQGTTTIKLVTGVATPEPATATLSLLALAGLAARRRRK